MKVICDRKWKEILGVHIVGPNATELIGEAALAIKLECSADELIDTIHATLPCRRRLWRPHQP